MLVRYIREPLILAFSTASSEAAYPRTLEALDRFGVPPRIASFVLPLGYSFNLDGSMLYMTFASIFIAQAYGIDLTLGQEITMLLVLMITSKGIAGVPRASLVVIAATLPLFDIPEAGLLLILAVDHFLDMGRSATNVVGNAVAASVVAKWEGGLDTLEPAEQEPAACAERARPGGRRGADALIVEPLLSLWGTAILPPLPVFAAFAGAGLLLNLVPGADVAFVDGSGRARRDAQRDRCSPGRGHRRAGTYRCRRSGAVRIADGVRDGVRNPALGGCRLSVVDRGRDRARGRLCGCAGRRIAAVARVSRCRTGQFAEPEGGVILCRVPAAVRAAGNSTTGGNDRGAGPVVRSGRDVGEHRRGCTGRERGAPVVGAPANRPPGAAHDGGMLGGLAVKLAVERR